MPRQSDDDLRTPLAPVAGGPRWYRARILLAGPFAAIVPPATIGLVSLIIMLLGGGRQSAVAGLIGIVISAPGLLLLGAPIADSGTYPMALLVSAIFWAAIGVIAAWRATRRPIAGWPDFWREYLLLWVATAVGVGIGIGVAAARIGGTLL